MQAGHHSARMYEVPSKGFNPHPARRPDASTRETAFDGTSPGSSFQSSSSPKTGCKWTDVRNRCWCPKLVSILIQPEDRMQEGICANAELQFLEGLFQSSSSPKTGCKHRSARGRGFPTALTTFQSSSSPKTGCKPYRTCRAINQVHKLVSILIQPEDRMQGSLPGVYRALPWFAVSILIQPEDRMQAELLSGTLCGGSFRCFNPHPARRPDASCALHTSADDVLQNGWSFNPHPARRPDARSAIDETNLSHGPRSFNPHPARRPDASLGPHALTWLRVWSLFQSSSSPKTGCKTHSSRCSTATVGTDVSILIQPEDRMQAAVARWRPLCHVCFNPHPARLRPDARTPAIRPRSPRKNVSILIHPKTGCKGPGTRNALGNEAFQSSSSPKTGCKSAFNLP